VGLGTSPVLMNAVLTPALKSSAHMRPLKKSIRFFSPSTILGLGGLKGGRIPLAARASSR
jgi:hypothetical protein